MKRAIAAALFVLLAPSLARAQRFAESGDVVVFEPTPDVLNAAGWADGGQQALAKRFYAQYPDAFDALVAFTEVNAPALQLIVKSDVDGLGIGPRDGTAAWGSSGALYEFVGMPSIASFAPTAAKLVAPESPLWPALAEEWAHRWCCRVTYRTAAGMVSSAMLRPGDRNHWSFYLQAFGSPIAGQQWADNADGTFTSLASPRAYSPLDLYLMGLAPPSTVQPFFLVQNPTALDGSPAPQPSQPIPGTRVRGTRENVTIQQVVTATGPRSPTDTAAPRSFRQAFVLVTAPGQPAEDALPQARLLEQAARAWQQTAFPAVTSRLATTCSQLAAPCGEPTARFVGARLTDPKGDGDGALEAGETVRVDVDLANDGASPAANASVALAAGDAQIAAPAAVTVASIAPGATATASFDVQVAAEVQCGQRVSLSVATTVGARTFRGLFTAFLGGLRFSEDFETSSGWQVNAQNRDGATAGAWEIGPPVNTRIPNGPEAAPGLDTTLVGENVLATGLAAGAGGDPAANDVDGGSTSITSPVIDLRDATAASLSFRYWFLKKDVANGRVTESADDDLKVEITPDGLAWLPVENVTASTNGWTTRAAMQLPPEGLTAKTRLRFTVTDAGPDSIVEAAIDSLVLQSCSASVPRKNPGGDNGGGGCTLGAGPAGSLAALALALVYAVSARRRRISRRGA